MASCRRAGGSAWRASRQWILPVVTTTAGRALWHRAAGRAAAHGEHEAAGTDCRYFGSGSYITASRPGAGGSAWIASRQSVLPVTALTAGRTSRHCAAGRAAARGKHRGSGYCLSPLRRWVAHPSRRPVRRQGVESMRQWVLPVATTTAGSTSRHRAAGRAAAHGEHRGSRYCLSSLRQQVVHHGIARRAGGSAWRA